MVIIVIFEDLHKEVLGVKKLLLILVLCILLTACVNGEITTIEYDLSELPLGAYISDCGWFWLSLESENSYILGHVIRSFAWHGLYTIEGAKLLLSSGHTFMIEDGRLIFESGEWHGLERGTAFCRFNERFDFNEIHSLRN